MRRLTSIEEQLLLDQTFENASIGESNLDLCRNVATLFCKLLRAPDGFNLVVMPQPSWFYGNNEQLFTASTRRFRAGKYEVASPDPVSIADDLCDALEDEMTRFYAEHGERCYLGLYWLPWKPLGDHLWSLRYVLGHEEYAIAEGES